MSYTIEELVSIPELQKLMERLYRAFGINHALLTPEGKILTAVGWRRLCTGFHRTNSATCARCIQSDCYISQHLHEAPYAGYKCLNGLWDYAIPVIIDGQHLATLFTGQLFHELPDLEFFRQQARTFGFDEADYLAAVQEIPVIPSESIPPIMDFLVLQAQTLAQSGMAKMRQLESAQQQAEQAEQAAEAARKSLRESEAAVRTKLHALAEQEGGFGALSLADVIDAEELQGVMDEFYRLTHIGCAIIDINGKVLVANGWQDICTKFHRCHPETLANCIESDTILSKGVQPGTYRRYRCKNNMWDMATPIIVGGEHVGNMFLGQFFFEDEVPDMELFRQQAVRCGFDEKEYLGALARVPRWSRETLDALMMFYSKFAATISRLSYSTVKLSRTLAERDRTEEALRESNRLLTLFLRHSPIYTYIKEVTPAASRVLQASDNFGEMIGIPGQDMKGKTMAELFPPEFAARITADDWAVVTRGEVLRQDEELNGRHYTTIKFPIVQGDKTLLAGYTIDITERKQAEAELERHRQHLKELVEQRTGELALLNQLVDRALEATKVGVWWNDFREPDTAHALDSTIRMMGLQPSPGKTYRFSAVLEHLMAGKMKRPEYAALLDHALAQMQGTIDGKFAMHQATYPVIMPDETVKWIDSRADVLRRGADGRPDLMVGALIDVTGFKQIEEELRLAKAAAEAASRAKSTFLANMSHELRTPLNAILGFSQLLANTQDATPDQKEKLGIILKSGEHLLELLNDVLDLAKIESGKLKVEPREFDLGNLMGELVSMLRPRAEAKGLRLRLDQTSSFPRFVRTDPAKLRQIIINLVGNAIKFTASGEVSIHLSVASVNHGTKCIRLLFVVSDTGPGIVPEDRERIFASFEQGRGGESTEGTGLGLTITRSYVSLLGGEISVESTIGKGSIFRFSIVCDPVDSALIPVACAVEKYIASVVNAAAQRILIVEDQADNRQLMTALLAPFGFQLREATDGREAVAVAKEWHPHLILMDRRMPVVDGLEATRELRKIPECRKIPVIAVTAHAYVEERQEMLDAGCDDFLGKPFRGHDLFDLLARHLDIRVRYAEPTPPPAAAPSLTPETFAGLPDDLRAALEAALTLLDMGAVERTIGRISQLNPALAAQLKREADTLAYSHILHALKRANESGKGSVGMEDEA